MKEIAVIFDRSVVLPGDGMVPLKSFGYIFPKTDLALPVNNRTYTKHYILVIAELFKDKTIEFVGKECFKKDGKVFYMDDDLWDVYDKMAEKTGVQFAILEIENTDVPREDRDDDYLLISEERWVALKGRDDVVWEQ